MKRKEFEWYKKMGKHGAYASATYYALRLKIKVKPKNKKSESIIDVLARVNRVGADKMKNSDKEFIDKYNWEVGAWNIQ